MSLGFDWPAHINKQSQWLKHHRRVRNKHQGRPPLVDRAIAAVIRTLRPPPPAALLPGSLSWTEPELQLRPQGPVLDGEGQEGQCLLPLLPPAWVQYCLNSLARTWFHVHTQCEGEWARHLAHLKCQVGLSLSRKGAWVVADS